MISAPFQLPVETLARKVLKSCKRDTEIKSLAGRPKATCLKVILNDINSHSEVELAITIYRPAETTRHSYRKLEDFVLRQRYVGKNGWHHDVYQADKCALHI